MLPGTIEFQGTTSEALLFQYLFSLGKLDIVSFAFPLSFHSLSGITVS
jgi:hypothetical protein